MTQPVPVRDGTDNGDPVARLCTWGGSRVQNAHLLCIPYAPSNWHTQSVTLRKVRQGATEVGVYWVTKPESRLEFLGFYRLGKSKQVRLGALKSYVPSSVNEMEFSEEEEDDEGQDDNISSPESDVSFLLPIRFPKISSDDSSLVMGGPHGTRMRWAFSMFQKHATSDSMKRAWNLGQELPPINSGGPECDLNVRMLCLLGCLATEMQNPGLEHLRRTVERAWLEFKVNQVQPDDRESFLYLNDLSQHFQLDDSGHWVAQIPLAQAPPSLVGQAKRGLVTVYWADLAAMAWQWHETFCARLALQIRQNPDGPASIASSDLWWLVHRMAQRRSSKQPGPLADVPPDIEDIPPCYRQALEARQGRWLTDGLRYPLATLFRTGGYSQLAFELQLAKHLPVGSSGPEKARQRYDASHVWRPESKYSERKCQTILEAGRGACLRCPFADSENPQGACVASFHQKNPNKKRSTDEERFFGPASWLWWARRRKR